MFRIVSGIYLGWGLGANNAANIFATGVASGVVRYRTAVILTAIFALIGAYFEGSKGIETYGKLALMDLNTAFIASLSAAITINVLTIFALPVSTSQAIVGSIVAVGIMSGGVSLKILTQVVLSWVLAPIGAAVISVLSIFFMSQAVPFKIAN